MALGGCLVSVYVRRLLDELLSIDVPWSRSSLVFSGFGLKPPASGFQSYLTVASRLLYLYSTDDKKI